MYSLSSYSRIAQLSEGNTPPGVAGVRYPIYAYENAGSNCAVIGAAFYRPAITNFPAEYAGRYFFGDYCGGFIRMSSGPSYTTTQRPRFPNTPRT